MKDPSAQAARSARSAPVPGGSAEGSALAARLPLRPRDQAAAARGMRRCPDGFQCDLRPGHRRAGRPDLFQRDRDSGADAAGPRVVGGHLGVSDRRGLRTGPADRRRRPARNRALRSGPRIGPRRLRRPCPSPHRATDDRAHRPASAAVSVATWPPALPPRIRNSSPGWSWRTRPCHPVPGPPVSSRMAPGMAISGAMTTLRRGRIKQNMAGFARARAVLDQLAQADPEVVGVALPDHRPHLDHRRRHRRR